MDEEYIFITPDGVKHYELVASRREAWAFHKMHGAWMGIPLERWEAMPESARRSCESQRPLCPGMPGTL